MVLCFYYFFSYPSLLELHYGGRKRKSQTAREWAREIGLLVREAEQRIDAELFLDEYPRWELGTPHGSIILHEMFLHTAEQGWKEVERLIHQGCQGSALEPDLGVGWSAMELVGYQTSHKEIWDIYHSVYLLRRSPGLPPCGAQQRGRVICDILSSLTSRLHRWGYPAATGEGWRSKDKWLPRPSRRVSYEEALKAAYQRALEMANVLRSDIERLSQGMRDVPQTCSRSWSRGRSHSRSHGRGHNQSHPQSHSWSRQLESPSGSQSRMRVTFWMWEIKPDPKEEEENYLPEPSISDIEVWLDWWADQLGTPCWWWELRAISGVKDPWKLAHKIWASFSIPEVRRRTFPGQNFTAPPAPKCLNRNAFLPDNLSYQDIWQQPFLLCHLHQGTAVLGRKT